MLLKYGEGFAVPSLYIDGKTAKKKGGKTGLSLSEVELGVWSVFSLEVQRKICMYKVTTYEEVRSDLEKSAGKILIHPAMRCSEEKVLHRLWEGKGIVVDGEINVLGNNLLGKLWMEIRDGGI